MNENIKAVSSTTKHYYQAPQHFLLEPLTRFRTSAVGKYFAVRISRKVQAKTYNLVSRLYSIGTFMYLVKLINLTVYTRTLLVVYNNLWYITLICKKPYTKPHLPIKYIFFSLFGTCLSRNGEDGLPEIVCTENAGFCFIFEDMTLQRLVCELGVVCAWWYICAYFAWCIVYVCYTSA